MGRSYPEPEKKPRYGGKNREGLWIGPLDVMASKGWTGMDACTFDDLGCVRFWNGKEWNGTVPFLDTILAFGFGMEWNALVPLEGIFLQYAERTGPADSAGRSGIAQCLSLINQI